MALSRTASKALACNGCQSWILRSFMATVGGSALAKPAIQPRQQRRTITQQPIRMNEARERIQKEEERVLNEINKDASLDPEPTQTTSEPTPSEGVPWYLQVQQPPLDDLPPAENPLAARQRIPDLPDHPPDLLQPLMDHISVELGLDSLSLLDLRSLDPPPALGANLLMLLGTARSEKHLHVSADKLCRWLRTEYRLRPYADGLLGRNELKLKMRRKAKRSRLLSSVGAKPTGETELDDGIRTGWVCVNVGRVEGGELPGQVEKVQRAEGVVGFGARTEGCSVVVQMLTEEKREELDLEKLWVDMLGRARREKAKEAGAEEASNAGGAGSANNIDMEAAEDKHQAADVPRQTQPSIAQQARAFHDATPASTSHPS